MSAIASTDKKATPVLESFDLIERGDAEKKSPLARAFRHIALVFFALVAATVVLEFSGLDRRSPSIVFDRDANLFSLERHKYLSAFDRFAILPAWILGVGSPVAAVSMRKRNANALRSGLFMLAVLALGPGLIVNGTKAVWGRPRPRDILEYGGRFQHQPIWKLGVDRVHCRSFPCGHASMGFYLMTPMFLGIESRVWGGRRMFLLLGLFWGSAIGCSRFIQGHHFLSDIMWSAGLVNMTGVFLHALLLAERPAATAAERTEEPTRLAA